MLCLCWPEKDSDLFLRGKPYRRMTELVQALIISGTHTLSADGLVGLRVRLVARQSRTKFGLVLGEVGMRRRRVSVQIV